MTDRELLELAAKAAGIEIGWVDPVWNDPGAVPYIHLLGGRLWNPLIDDGDAMRLAVKLQKYYVEIKLGKGNNLVGCGVGPYWCEETTVDNPEAATRRAIVRAAAEIGKLIT